MNKALKKTARSTNIYQANTLRLSQLMKSTVTRNKCYIGWSF